MLFNTVLLSLLAVSVSSVFASPIPGNCCSTPKPKPKPKPAANDNTYALAARDLSSWDADEISFEKRSLLHDVSGGVDVVERSLGDEGLELYIRDLEDDQAILERSYLEEPESELERRSKAGKRIGNFFKGALKMIFKRDEPQPEQFERRSKAGKRIGNFFKGALKMILKRDESQPEQFERRSKVGKKIGNFFKGALKMIFRRQNEPTESELVTRDLGFEQKDELLERDVAPEAEVELFERDFEPQSEMEILERDFEPESEAELFERDFEPEEMDVFERGLEGMEDFEDLE